MTGQAKHLAVVGQPLAPLVVTCAQNWLTRLKRNDITLQLLDKATPQIFEAIVYLSSSEGTPPELLQTIFTENLTPNGIAVVPIAREDAWLLTAFLKGQGTRTLTYGLGNAEVVLHPNRALPEGLDVTLKYNTLQSSFTLPVEDEGDLVVFTAALALLVASGVDPLDLLPLLTAA